MLTRLTHPLPNMEQWVDLSEIIYMERYKKASSAIIDPNEKSEQTAFVLRGKPGALSCMETPEQILALMQGKIAISAPQPVPVETKIDRKKVLNK